MPRRPYLKFFGGDWLNDPKLRAVDFAERGMWIDLIALMMQGDPFGTISPALANRLHRVLGCHHHTSKKLVKSLLDAGILRSYPDGTLYSKRMIDDEKSLLDSEYYGMKGAMKRYRPPKPPAKASPSGTLKAKSESESKKDYFNGKSSETSMDLDDDQLAKNRERASRLANFISGIGDQK